MSRDRARLVQLLASVNPTPAGDHLAGLCHEAAAMLAGETEGVAFPVGTEVEKIGGDYAFAGPVVGVVRKRAGAVRYVVEDDRGALHIFRGEQLRTPPVACIGVADKPVRPWGWPSPAAPRWRHRKRGTTYVEMARGVEVQAARPIVEIDRIVVYAGPDGRLWARPEAEFDDGRFEPVEREA